MIATDRGEGGVQSWRFAEKSREILSVSSRTLALVRLRRGEGDDESDESRERDGRSLEEEEWLVERWGEGGEVMEALEGVEESFAEKDDISLEGKESLGEVGRLGERGRVADVRARGEEGGDACG
jgi:hypothetical protein